MCGLTVKSLETKPRDWVLSMSSEPCFRGSGPGVRGAWQAQWALPGTNTGVWEAATETEGAPEVHGEPSLAPRRRLTKQTHPRRPDGLPLTARGP